jgi:hypothetical protein
VSKSENVSLNAAVPVANSHFTQRRTSMNSQDLRHCLQIDEGRDWLRDYSPLVTLRQSRALDVARPSNHFADGCRRGDQKITAISLDGIMSHSSAQNNFPQRLQPMAAMFFVAVAFWLNSAMAQAGPCTADISQLEATVHQSEDDPFAGLTARQSVNAQLHRQPTPESLHRADRHLKARFFAAIARAKQYDAQGNGSGCTRALDAARKIYIP